MTPHEALNDISHELMQRHTDLVVNGWDVKSVRMLKEAIGKRQLIVRQALNELHKVKCELGQVKSKLEQTKSFARKAYQEGYEMHKFEMGVGALIKSIETVDEVEKTKNVTHEQARRFLNDIVQHGNCDFTNIQSMAYDGLVIYINQQAGIITEVGE